MLKMLPKGHVANMLAPPGNNSMGGVNPSFLTNTLLNSNPIKYAIVRPTKNQTSVKVRAFALLHDKNNGTRYLELIAGQGYGSKLVNTIVTNGKIVTLSAVASNSLRSFYANLLKHG